MKITLDTNIKKLSFFQNREALCMMFYKNGIISLRDLLLADQETLLRIRNFGPKSLFELKEVCNDLENTYHFSNDLELKKARELRSKITLDMPIYKLDIFKKNSYYKSIGLSLMENDIITLEDLLKSTDASIINASRLTNLALTEIKKYLTSLQDEYHFSFAKEELSLDTKISSINELLPLGAVIRNLESHNIITIADLIDANDEEVLKARNVGKKKLLKIKEILEEVINSIPVESKENSRKKLIFTLKEIEQEKQFTKRK